MSQYLVCVCESINLFATFKILYKFGFECFEAKFVTFQWPSYTRAAQHFLQPQI